MAIKTSIKIDFIVFIMFFDFLMNDE